MREDWGHISATLPSRQPDDLYIPGVMIKRIVLGTLATAVLTACGGPDPDVMDRQQSTVEPNDADSSETTTAQGTILESGLGQSDQYVWVMALVQNKSDHAGQTVTVNFNVKDSSGKLVGSGSQVAAFNWVGQTLPVATQIDLGERVKAAEVEATVLVEDDGTFDDQVVDKDWGTFPGKVYRQYGNWGAKFQIMNPTSEALTGAAVEVVCRNASGRIIGGSSTYPDLIPPSGETLVDASNLYSGARPHECTAYLHPWM